MVTPEYWLECYEHCRAGSKHFGCEGCPACTGHVDQFGLCEDCGMALQATAAEIIGRMTAASLSRTMDNIVVGLTNTCDYSEDYLKGIKDALARMHDALLEGGDPDE